MRGWLQVVMLTAVIVGGTSAVPAQPVVAPPPVDSGEYSVPTPDVEPAPLVEPLPVADKFAPPVGGYYEEPAHAHVHLGHGHHHEEEEHEEEELGRLQVSPYYRSFSSDIWDRTFDDMVGFNVGTTFWKHWKGEEEAIQRRVGFVTEFTFGYMDAEDDVNLNGFILNPFDTNVFNYRVDHAELYAGTLGVAFEMQKHLGESKSDKSAIHWGMAPLLTVGNLATHLEANPFPAGDQQIFLKDEPTDNGTLVNFDLRGWTGMTFSGGARAGVMGFWGYGETDSVFGTSERLATYGGGLYVDLPTRFIPEEFPAPSGTFQWVEEIFGLE